MAFWKPGTVAPGSNQPVTKSSQLDRENEKEASVPVYNSFGALSIQQQRVRLPIFKSRDAILYALQKYQVVVIVGETGSGKTTQIPQYLHESGWANDGKDGKMFRCVGCTQPRRVAATSVAARVAEEMGVPLGREVGYTIRFDDQSDPNTTIIKYLTDGMLVREMLIDPLISKYSVIMVDEAHERSLYTDIILGLLKKIARKRKDLRIIVSSATINAEDMKDFFNTNTTRNPANDTCTIMSIEGRTFPVDIHYTIKPVADYIKASLETVLEIHKTQPQGDILVFLTGQEEIDNLVTMIRDRTESDGSASRLRVLPMYSGIPHDKVMLVFEPAPPRTRKIVVATNIAETSITIDGIVYVVDCGFVKIRAYNPRLGIETLLVQPTSQATAKQRAGRAGRNRPGKCYRLYTEEAHEKLTPLPIPEMQRTNLSTVVLQLKALGIDNVLRFDFMSSPPSENMIRALEILYSLGALDDDGKLTEPVGTTMAEFPIEPYMAKILLSSGEEQFHCSEEILTIAALVSVQSIWSFTQDQRTSADTARRKFAVYEGDHLTLLNVYNAFLRSQKSSDWCKHHFLNYRALLRAIDIRNQLKRYMKRWRVPIVSAEGDHTRIRRCLVSGFFAHAARLQPDGRYKTLRANEPLSIHPLSVLNNRQPEWVIFHEVVQTTQLYMREITVIEPKWLSELAPHFYEFSTPASRYSESATR